VDINATCEQEERKRERERERCTDGSTVRHDIDIIDNGYEKNYFV